MKNVSLIADYTEEQLAAMTEEEINSLVKDYYEKTKQSLGGPHTTYVTALEGSTTRDGGVVVCSLDLGNRPTIRNADTDQMYSQAVVGDLVRYEDGTTATIISGAGVASIFSNCSVALVGSVLDNGDVIIKSPSNSAEIRQYHDAAPIEGLLIPNWKRMIPESNIPS